ncbi:MAG TPA: HAD family hydrolase [Blastocatellia bacterium]|jgi:phosphoserine phosphatase
MKKKQSIAKKINPFKLFYYRKTVGLTLEELAEKTAISLDNLKRFEQGTSQSQGKPHCVADFAELDDASLRKIEAALNCKGKLRGGQDDDFATQILHYYEVHKPQDGSISVIPDGAARQEVFFPKAIVFDFDGTLTKPGVNRTTWERLWTKIGYTPNDCGMLAHRFFKKEIDHEQWCRITLEKFKEKGLRRDDVLAVGRSISLIDGFESTIQRINQSGIPMYIVSGSIWDVLISTIGKFATYFKRIEANVFSYTPDDVIANIVGTRYDFEGKAEFVKKVAKGLCISTSQILFVGNSSNDAMVKTLSGAKTMLVNPHFTGPSQEWDIYIPHMESLTEILPYIGITDSSPADQAEIVSKADQIIDLLMKEDALDLNRYTVVGGYRRFNSQIRSQLFELCQQITTSLSKKTQDRQNYLICAAPGSGKTYFIQEIANSVRDKTLFVEIDLSKDSEEVVRQKLNQIGGGESSCLCMIDEIDGRAGEQWPYDVIYKKLDVNEEPTCRATTVFTLIGSSGGDVNGLIKAINSRYKAKDLIDRIPENSKYYIQIPPLELGDGICVYVSKVLEASAKKDAGITHVEKMAIFHAAMTALKSPRQIKMLADHAVERVQRNGTVLRYDHHFEPGDTENKRFWGEHQKATESLHPGDIKIAQ